jgi:NAD(P)-dependent dehydrogenase (short-subunit alcohol dehydrogenase family)
MVTFQYKEDRATLTEPPMPDQPATQFATYPSLRDRLVLITGGASGIGAALVEAFAAQRAQVLFLDRDDASAQALLARLAHHPHPPVYFSCDLTDQPALDRTLATLLAAHPALDVLINNAGDDTRHATEDVTPASWDRTLALNLKHQFFVTQAVLPGMKQRQRGSIINMSSISWIIPSTGLPVYIAAKAALVGLTRTFAHELGPHNIRVNAILPGAIQTPRQHQLWYTPEYIAEILSRQALKRLLVPEEVARLALFLAADDSAGITSQSHILDAGWV